MQKGREITGLPVVSLASGKEIGSVDDILWSHPDLKIRNLVVGEHYLPFPGISAIGTDAVTISGPEVLEEQDEERIWESSRMCFLMPSKGKLKATNYLQGLSGISFPAE